jgi:hypothetical protein
MRWDSHRERELARKMEGTVARHSSKIFKGHIAFEIRGNMIENALEAAVIEGDHRAKSSFFLPLPFLCSFAVVDVGKRGMPTTDVALLVPDRRATPQEPTIGPVPSARSKFTFERKVVRKRTIPMKLDRLQILWMKLGVGSCITPAAVGGPEKIKPHPVYEKAFPVGSQDGYELRCKIQDLLEFLLAYLL